MEYRSDDGTESEVVWNARDGVTPFVITLRSGKPATHVNWRSDVYAPDHHPAIGDRIFTDLTPERARFLAERQVDAWLADPVTHDSLLAAYGSREQAIEQQALLAEPGAPDLVVVAG